MPASSSSPWTRLTACCPARASSPCLRGVRADRVANHVGPRRNAGQTDVDAERGGDDVAGLRVAVAGDQVAVAVGEVGQIRAEHSVDLVLDAAQLALAGGVLDLAAQPRPGLVGRDHGSHAGHQGQQFGAQQVEVAAGLGLVAQDPRQFEEHDRRGVGVDLDRPSAPTGLRVDVEAEPFGDPRGPGAVRELGLTRVGRVGGRVIVTEVPAELLFGRTRPGGIGDHDRGVDRGEAVALNVRGQGGFDLVVGVHRAHLEQPCVVVDDRDAGGLFVAPREVDTDVVHPVTFASDRPAIPPAPRARVDPHQRGT